MRKRVAVHSGLTQGWTEFRQAFSGVELPGQLFWPVVTLTALFLLRHRTYGHSGFTLGALMLPGVLGMQVAFGMFLVVQALAADREDGTLLRAKATPDGMRGYVIGKLLTTSLTVLAYLIILLLPGLLMFPSLAVAHWGAWLTLAWVLVLGLVATQSIGFVLGALVKSAQGVGVLSLPMMALIGMSGVFYPLAALPVWVQWVAQTFPVYWLGLGMRSALLPASAAAIEIGGSWRALETLGVLGLWAVAGLFLAPRLLSRMTRRESGAALEQRQAAVKRRS